MASFTPDSRTVFFVRRIYPDATRSPAPNTMTPTLTVMMSELRGDRWSEPIVAPFSGWWRDIDPVVSPDGKQVFFNSTRPGPGRDSAATDFDIWVVDRLDDARWGEPRRLPAPVNGPRGEYFASVTRDGTLYYTVSGSAPRESYIVRARPLPSGDYTTPESLTVVNASATAGNPFIAPDESYLLFVANGPGGYGDSDIYLSRRSGSTWTAPRNLGPTVNTALAEFAPSVSPDGRWLYFTRMTRGEAGAPPVRAENVMVVRVAW
jgi:Tol biopolymer transport system component